MAQKHLKDALQESAPTIADKIIAVATERDGLTANIGGYYLYQVVGNASDYQIQSIGLDEDGVHLEAKPKEAVVTVENGKVLYIANHFKDYVHSSRVIMEEIKEGENVEQKVLLAMREYTVGRFGFGHMVFLEDKEGFNIVDAKIDNEAPDDQIPNDINPRYDHDPNPKQNEKLEYNTINRADLGK